MKRLGLITALLLSSSACGGKSAPDMPPVGEFPAVGEGAKTIIRAPGENTKVLRYAAKAGDKNVADMDVDMSMSGGGLDVSFKMQIGAENSIDEVDDKGSFRQSMTITGAVMKLGGKLAEMGGDTSQIGDMLKGQKMSFKMDNQGRVLEADMGGDNNPMMKQMQAGMDQAMQGGVVPFPSDAVGVGAQWDALTTVDMMGAKMRLITTYKLIELSGDKGMLEVALGGNSEAQKMNMQGTEVDLKSMNLKANGKIGFDLGRPTAGSVDLKLKLEMDLSAEGQRATMKMDMGVKMTSR